MLSEAQMVMKKALKSFQSGRAEVLVRRSEKDPVTKVMREVESVLFAELPCRVSFRAAKTSEGAFLSSAEAEMVLFVDPGTEIPEGSRILVVQEGETYALARSSPAKVYPSHWEYGVTLSKEGL